MHDQVCSRNKELYFPLQLIHLPQIQYSFWKLKTVFLLRRRIKYLKAWKCDLILRLKVSRLETTSWQVKTFISTTHHSLFVCDWLFFCFCDGLVWACVLYDGATQAPGLVCPCCCWVTLCKCSLCLDVNTSCALIKENYVNVRLSTEQAWLTVWWSKVGTPKLSISSQPRQWS